MEDAGLKLKRAREKLRLKFRDVEEASGKIASRHGNDEFIVSLSRLADFEKGAMPSMFKLYSLCVIYSLSFDEVLGWYGISANAAPADADLIDHGRTHPIGLRANGSTPVQFPVSFDPGIDVTKTVFLTRLIQQWGTVPLALFDRLNFRDYRYGLIGTGDWSMHPLIPPGSLVVIDETRKRIQNSGWTDERYRPIYFLEHQEGYVCGWCNENENRITVSFHPSSSLEPKTYAFPEQIDNLGQVTCVAMSLDVGPRPARQP
jgi:transcriptional regulator with XRE-family HTH domain